MPTTSIPFAAIQAFKQKFQSSVHNFAYELLLLQMKIQEYTSNKNNESQRNKPSIQQITRIMELYMLAVQLLQSSSDKRFRYFGEKIQHLMMKKVIVEQLHTATGSCADKKTLEEVSKVEMELKRQQHQMQIYFHQQQADIKNIQLLLKKSDKQANNVEGRIRNQLTSQQKNLEERIKSRKKRSQAGSVTKFKLSGAKTNEDGLKIEDLKQKELKTKQRDIRMEYFVDYNEKSNFDQGIKSPPKKRFTGSGEKPQIPGYQNRFSLTPTPNKKQK